MTDICFCNLDKTELAAIGEMSKELGITHTESAEIKVTVKKGDCISLSGNENGILLTYRKKSELFRALSHLPCYLKNGKEIKENGNFDMLCYMCDCSRNAVIKVSAAKTLIRRLARMGYDSLMLYTEDTYTLEDYKYFGFMRGRYTDAELKELDAYAAMFGIELIPCIQTLAHLRTALRWPDFDGYKDNDDILMVGDDRTYKFLTAAIRQCRRCFGSKRINIGMDEAHLIACGEYLKRNGYRKPSDVMLEHLNRVVKICHEHDLSPMIWGDMFFRMAFGGNYYVDKGEISPEVISKVPDGVTLVHWDYYTLNPDRIEHMFKCYKQFNNPCIFAAGAWKWYGFGAHNGYSILASEAALKVCKKLNINSFIVTSWGDNGGEASQFAAMQSTLYFAERCYNLSLSNDLLNKRATACIGTDYDTLSAFDLPDLLPEIAAKPQERPCNPSKYLLYNDPLERLFDRHYKRKTASKTFKEHSQKLLSLKNDAAVGYALEVLGLLCSVLELKCDLGTRIYEAYQNGDKSKLEVIANNDIPEIIERIESFLSAFRSCWLKENKSSGLVNHEIRLGGLKERLCSVRITLNDYISGKTDRIDELTFAPLPVKPQSDGEYIFFNNWAKNVSSGII